MTARMKASAFDDLGLTDWRYLVGRIEANFLFPTYAAAGAFAARVAILADDQGHHPDLDVRPPGLVHLVSTTHEIHDVTEGDAELARVVSALADELGAGREPVASTTTEIAIDVLDIDLVRPFWSAVLDYVDQPARVPGGTVRAIRDPRGVGANVWFQQMDEGRPQRNRIHLDVVVAHDAAEQRLEAALAAGGRLLSDERARAFWVLADPEGNEACICTWLDRGN